MAAPPVYPPMRIPLILLTMMLSFAGCMDDDDEDDDVASAADLDYSGSSDGQHSETARCSDGSAQLSGVGSINTGSIQVTVTDGSGSEVFTNMYDDNYELEGEMISGSGGQWTLMGQRSGAFDGDYAFSLLCS